MYKETRCVPIMSSIVHALRVMLEWDANFA